MTTKNQQYEQAIQQEIKNQATLAELEKKSDKEYQNYLNKCAEEINKFLEQKGSDVRFDATKDASFDFFAACKFEEGGKMQNDFFEFVDNKLPRFKQTVEIPHELYHSSLTDFVELNIPLNLKREDFSSDEHYRIYKGHVRAILSDRD